MLSMIDELYLFKAPGPPSLDLLQFRPLFLMSEDHEMECGGEGRTKSKWLSFLREDLDSSSRSGSYAEQHSRLYKSPSSQKRGSRVSATPRAELYQRLATQDEGHNEAMKRQRMATDKEEKRVRESTKIPNSSLVLQHKALMRKAGKAYRSHVRDGVSQSVTMASAKEILTAVGYWSTQIRRRDGQQERDALEAALHTYLSGGEGSPEDEGAEGVAVQWEVLRGLIATCSLILSKDDPRSAGALAKMASVPALAPDMSPPTCLLAKRLRAMFVSERLAYHQRPKSAPRQYRFQPDIDRRSAVLSQRAYSRASQEEAEGLRRLGEIPSVRVPKDRVDVLLSKQRSTDLRVEYLRRLKAQDELAECTFAPNTQTSRHSAGWVLPGGRKEGEGERGRDVFEALYSLQGKEGDTLPSSLERELLTHCTFHPQTGPEPVSVPLDQQPRAPRGYQEAVSRMRRGHRETQDLKQAYENLGKVKASALARPAASPSPTPTLPRGRGRASASQSHPTEGQDPMQGVSPLGPEDQAPVHETPSAHGTHATDRGDGILLATSTREAARQLSVPLLYVDVQIGPGKKGRIGVREGDNPRDLVDAFCSMWALGSGVHGILLDLVVSSIKQNCPAFDLSVYGLGETEQQ
ncbi:hypothetical protein KIPB_000404 [Kipferlia bialata]|uniref:Uncharacterized protein n=1 Tax=Kipferlia bialata TaxID=797122 RepID=A0A9K3CNR0_9EUKA|nr:hypothetical protein KIPB_000404 [Kipferlia bialata]|eukprot:g404.t1